MKENNEDLAADIRHHHEELKRELAEIDAQSKWPRFEQDNHGEWVARAGCGHIGNPDEMSDDGMLCVDCADELDKVARAYIAKWEATYK